MSDYISREAAIKAVQPTNAPAINFVLAEMLNKVPAADVRPVVRCRDCRWWTKQEKSLQGRCELTGFYPTGEWFCANGECPNCGAEMRGDADEQSV